MKHNDKGPQIEYLKEEEMRLVHESQSFLNLLINRNLTFDTAAHANKTKRNLNRYHNTKLLLKSYRDISWAIEYYPTELVEELDGRFAGQSRCRTWYGQPKTIHTRHGFLYLAVFVDVFSRKVTGWAMGTRVKDALTMSALYQAVGREHPNAGLIVHTDRGAQYTSHRFTALLQRYQFRQSMSRKGNPYDNAIMESF